jgi:hypothetical protein
MNLHSLFLALLLISPSSRATSFFVPPFADFTRDAENIVRGRIHQPHAEIEIGSDGQRLIYTYAEVEVIEVLKGGITKPSIPIRKLGGTKDGITLEIPGSPDLDDESESVLFLGKEQENHFFEFKGLELGQFGLEEKNGATVLTGGVLGLPENPEIAGITQNVETRTWTLAQLRALIKSQGASPLSPADSGSKPVNRSSPPPETPKGQADTNSGAQPSPSPNAPESSSELPPSQDSTQAAGLLFLMGGVLLGLFFYLRRK